ncbi:hypothetical protein AWJ20_4173 [Sugiyamaella lignohabitans]|uniref:Heme-degrading domain-containing protein n=1 Tax=Sugiyamaella lignohabitans TaxID=796027 RepID=A0A161HH64_9ASCO|nr:uncharacterized protein AWJ20_4173 [Sugiyamaella lignohabitans]ANB11367.1 hypothetical protein AWJ20_4173 [Sugiyamaella lignohabitans]
MVFTAEQLDQLREQEKETILPAFNSDVAWELGQIVRKNALKFPNSVLISITGANGLVLFQTTTRSGVTLDNQSWVERKRRVVTYFEKSSFLMGRSLEADNIGLDLFGKSDADYATHGGGFPIRVKGTDSLAGVVVVSGLKQEDDHAVAVESIKQYLATLA